MKRARLLAPGELVFEDIDLTPDAVGRGDVFAHTEYSAVSIGTEYAAFAGQPPLRPGPVYPRLVGYCNVARVVRCGDDVVGVRPGNRILTNQPHQSAFICAAGDVLASVPEAVPSPTAAVVYLAGLGLAALQKARYRTGEHVAVLGLGVIGLATAAVAIALGAHVIAIGNDVRRLAAAAALGVPVCVRVDSDDARARIDATTHGAGIDVLVTTANPWSAWHFALEISRPQGRIAVLGFPGRGEGPPPFNPLASEYFYDKQLSIYGAGIVPPGPMAPGEKPFTLAKNMELLLGLVEQGRLPLDRLITDVVAWKDLRLIYERAGRRDRTMLGAVLDWSA